MAKLYKDINTIKLQFLLEATPFTVFKEINFSNKLSEKIFFSEIYVPGGKTSGLDARQVAEIVNFENGIRNAIIEFGNEHARVSLIHIKGYGGCGKTTFVHSFLRDLKKEHRFHSDFLDFEKAKNAEAPLIRKITDYMLDKKRDSKSLALFLFDVSGKTLLNMDQFDEICHPLKEFANDIREIFTDSLAEGSQKGIEIESCFIKIRKTFLEADQFLFFLFVTFLLMQIYDHLSAKKINKNAAVIVIDNVDSMEPLSEEMRLIPTLRKFTDRCSIFVADNVDNNNLYAGNPVGRLFEKSKFVFILATRLVTARRYSVLESYRGNENQREWMDFEIPESYYDHEAIIQKRISFFEKQEENNEHGLKIQRLSEARDITSMMYKVPIFKKLFNGNLRYCIAMICYISDHTDMMRLIEKCYELDNRAYSREFREGINGIILNIILKRFKSTGIYDRKLHLTECCPDGNVSCSRLILTILREKDDACSMYDLFEYLYPIFSLNEICKCVMDLSEEGREVWRRLLTFDKIFPTDVDDLRKQGKAYEEHETDRRKYSNIVMTIAGKVYIEQIVPHFEFMFSRHSKEITDMVSLRNQPLFMDDNLEIITTDGERLYRFEKTISIVFNDVKDCCYNALNFECKLLSAKKIVNEEEYLSSPYNYRSIDRAEVPGAKQSYESRLIFRHVGYIERYRMFLLKKHDTLNIKDKSDINKRIIYWIRKYINQYDKLVPHLQTKEQDEAALILMERMDAIEKANYRDFTTRIEVD